jgi:hypothetical protein
MSQPKAKKQKVVTFSDIILNKVDTDNVVHALERLIRGSAVQADKYWNCVAEDLKSYSPKNPSIFHTNTNKLIDSATELIKMGLLPETSSLADRLCRDIHNYGVHTPIFQYFVDEISRRSSKSFYSAFIPAFGKSIEKREKKIEIKCLKLSDDGACDCKCPASEFIDALFSDMSMRKFDKAIESMQAEPKHFNCLRNVSAMCAIEDSSENIAKKLTRFIEYSGWQMCIATEINIMYAYFDANLTRLLIQYGVTPYQFELVLIGCENVALHWHRVIDFENAFNEYKDFLNRLSIVPPELMNIIVSY